MRLILVSLTTLLLMGACSMGSEPSAEPASKEGGASSPASIEAIDNEFQPTELELTPGEEVTVTLTNNGETIHTFTSEELGFDTGNVEPGDTAEVTFTTPDEESRFVCTIHEGSDDMVGRIVPTT